MAGVGVASLMLGLWPPQPVLGAGRSLALTAFATGLTAPVDIANTGVAGDTRLFAVEQAGVIKVIQSNGTVLGTPFLDINPQVKDGGGEEGLLGLAFHPNYASNGWFYVFYNNTAGDLVIARFTRSAGNANVADGTSEQVVLTIPHPTNSNHNGGDLNFGPTNGYLYVATGDGGGGGDPGDNAQNKASLLGKLLRLDVNGDDFPADATKDYAIPSSNPYVGQTGADEIWALGLRNPWRFSFDRQTHDLYIGDVGQGSTEEVDFEAAGSTGGANYGWRCYEGVSAYNTSGCGAQGTYRGPIGWYSSAVAAPCSVTGGYVYRGSAYPALQGYYLFADFCSGEFSTLVPQAGGGWEQRLQLTAAGRMISTFGEDINGELYAGDIANGIVYRIDPGPSLPASPVYRMANFKTKERLFTINAAERDHIRDRDGWVYEGVAYNVYSNGNIPVYRLANFITKERLFTTNAGEKDAISGRNGWVYEGVAFKADSAGTIEVYRLANFISKERLFTTNRGERDAIQGRNGWVYEGVAFRVVP